MQISERNDRENEKVENGSARNFFSSECSFFNFPDILSNVKLEKWVPAKSSQNMKLLTFSHQIERENPEESET